MNSLFLLWPVLLIPIAIAVILIAIFATRKNTKIREMFESKNERRNYYISLDVIKLESARAKKLLKEMGRKFLILKNTALVLLVLLCLSTAILVARPAKNIRTDERISQREIVLCLDVSGSTLIYDRQILSGYKQIVSSFSGERVALVIFDSTARAVFPLTNDYTMINQKLDDALLALAPVGQNSDLELLQPAAKEKLQAFLTGTNTKTDSASLIGDGLASCALQFSQNDDKNPRYIVFSTDNVLSGNPIFTLEDAAALATERKAKIYGIYSGTQNSEGSKQEAEMKKVIVNASGVYYLARTASSVNEIVTEISQSQLSDPNIIQAPLVIDAPLYPLLVFLFVFVIYIIVIWRMKQ